LLATISNCFAAHFVLQTLKHLPAAAHIVYFLGRATHRSATPLSVTSIAPVGLGTKASVALGISKETMERCAVAA
jgi:hypothetical protein